MTTHPSQIGNGCCKLQTNWPASMRPQRRPHARRDLRRRRARRLPRGFTAAMIGAAQGYGAELRHGRITGITRHPDGATVGGVEVDGGVVEADAVVVALGPWSLISAGWLSLPAVFGQRSPSLVYD